MRLCTAHWDELRQLIADVGLARFCTEKGGLVRLRDGEFDPLTAAVVGLYMRALRDGGLEVMEPNADGGERCPVCWLAEGCGCGRGDECGYRQWPRFAVSAQLEVARANGLLPPPS